MATLAHSFRNFSSAPESAFAVRQIHPVPAAAGLYLHPQQPLENEAYEWLPRGSAKKSQRIRDSTVLLSSIHIIQACAKSLSATNAAAILRSAGISARHDSNESNFPRRLRQFLSPDGPLSLA